MYHNNKLKQLRKMKKEVIDASRELDAMMEAARANKDSKSFEKFRAKLNSLYSEVAALNLQIDEVCQGIEKYAVFDFCQLGQVISSLVSIFEGEKFEYTVSKYYPLDKNEKQSVVKMIVLSTKSFPEGYTERYVNSLIKKGNAMVLTRDGGMTSMFQQVYFYTAGENHTLVQNIGCGRLSYVKEFIDEVIDYKIALNKTQLSDSEFDKLMNDFIGYNVSRIEQNYFSRDKKERDEFFRKQEKKKESRAKQLLKYMSTN